MVLFASGMAAGAALLLTELGPGDAVAIDTSCYLDVRRLATTHLERHGVEVRLAPAAELAAAVDGAALLWLESPSNPKLEVCDIAALAGAARAAGALCVVDNTTAGPLLQRPLDLGAGAVLTSATKQMAGHADLVLGLRGHPRARAGAARCATGAATPGRSPGRSRPGSPTARCRRWRCGSSAAARTPARWPG